MEMKLTESYMKITKRNDEKKEDEQMNMQKQFVIENYGPSNFCFKQNLLPDLFGCLLKMWRLQLRMMWFDSFCLFGFVLPIFAPTV